uniref:SRCR domain-containing protein n=1 Tax=Amazona collaria TaxID=241587 RepID=A0A8B9G658_9PSIT
SRCAQHCVTRGLRVFPRHQGFSGLRLTGRDTACSGHLKVKQETWLTVCFSHIDFKAASVICNELECGEAVGISRGTHFGDKHEQIWQEKFHCLGNETHLAHCPRMLLHNKTCSHDATVVCSGYGGYRLANGSTRCSGRVELLHGGTWGTLCDYLWDLPAANDLCQQLDCGVALQIPDGQSFGKGNGSVWNGTFSCKNNGSYQRDCFVSVLEGLCGAKLSWGRLVNGTTCSGRVEIRHGDTWGRLCQSHWNLKAANVLCHQLNCGYAKSIQTEDDFAAGDGPVWRDAFHCNGTESCLWDCAQVTLGNPSCSAREPATVVCSDVIQYIFTTLLSPGLAESLRLSGGESRCDGRVEILLHGIWSRVLDDDWDIKDAHVVCRQLECGIAKKAYYLPRSERGTGVVGLRSVQCAGNETQLMLCQTSHSPTVPSGVAEDVGVVCSGELLCKRYRRLPRVKSHPPCAVVSPNLKQAWNIGTISIPIWPILPHIPTLTWELNRFSFLFRQIRLVNATKRCAGRVELYHDGVWGTICDDYWDLSDANVVCKQLGCGHAIKAFGSAHYGEGSGQIWLDDVKCTGAESDIWACPARALGQHNCQHKEDAGVLCSGVVTSRPMEVTLSLCSALMTTHLEYCIQLSSPQYRKDRDLWRGSREGPENYQSNGTPLLSGKPAEEKTMERPYCCLSVLKRDL